MSIEMSARSLDEVLLARELGNWRTSSLSGPAYLGLADAIRLLIVDGRLPVGARYPSERALADALRVSRTTVTAAYAQLREDGYLNARRGARSTTALPPTAPTTSPAPLTRTGTLSLADAAPSAPAAATVEAFTRAAQRLAPHLHDIGIELTGVAELRQAIAERYCARGLPTDPDEIMVTTGALHAINLVLATYARPGDRVLIEQPTYHGAISLIAASGARPVPVSMAEDGWELDAVQAAMRQLAPNLAYLIVDNHNPTGLSLPAPGRERLARIISETRTRTIIDETICDIWLDEPLPPPLASYLESRRDLVVTVGSMSKSFWGGLRVGWIRAERSTLAAIAAVRPTIDLGTAIVEQLASAELLRQADTVLPARRDMLRARRQLVGSLLQEQLPDWTASPCHGGMSMWMRLPAPMSSALSAAASRMGLVIPGGPRFGVDGTLERFIRVPFTQPEERLHDSVAVLAQAWRSVTGAGTPDAQALIV
ncbi:PLP-dependent aminotransferase family protein [Mycolicibacterium sp. lyk4-40-TYG-92]|uniref:MocR-like transcription factor YczR n=1 Tax=Mycolicibacterium sp. lyk4-40-TYG-92 TaxID=3040295 RepID=UPI0025507805|nr:PLP-dependent aminotransferase family protein [Mycolicibacterium sp. lyk4-40-TYG-92]